MSLPKSAQTLGHQPAVSHVPELRILGLGRTILGADWTYKLHDNSWRLYRMNEEGAALRVEGGRFDLPARCPVLVPAWLPIECIPGEGLQQDYIHFVVPDWPSSLVRQNCHRPRVLSHVAGLEEQICHAGDLAKRARGTSPLHGLRLLPVLGAAAMALDAYLHELRAANFQALDEAYRGNHPVQELAREIASRPLEPWDVRVLAARIRCTREHLSRLFRTYLHQSPAQYIREQRLNAAARLLLQTHVSIEKIAADCQFADRYSFSKAFAKQFHKSPARFRAEAVFSVTPYSG